MRDGHSASAVVSTVAESWSRGAVMEETKPKEMRLGRWSTIYMIMMTISGLGSDGANLLALLRHGKERVMSETNCDKKCSRVESVAGQS